MKRLIRLLYMILILPLFLASTASCSTTIDFGTNIAIDLVDYTRENDGNTYSVIMSFDITNYTDSDIYYIRFSAFFYERDYKSIATWVLESSDTIYKNETNHLSFFLNHNSIECVYKYNCTDLEIHLMLDDVNYSTYSYQSTYTVKKFGDNTIDLDRYNRGIEYYKMGSYYEASLLFKGLCSYRDSEYYYNKCLDALGY